MYPLDTIRKDWMLYRYGVPTFSDRFIVNVAFVVVDNVYPSSQTPSKHVAAQWVSLLGYELFLYSPSDNLVSKLSVWVSRSPPLCPRGVAAFTAISVRAQSPPADKGRPLRLLLYKFLRLWIPLSNSSTAATPHATLHSTDLLQSWRIKLRFRRPSSIFELFSGVIWSR